MSIPPADMPLAAMPLSGYRVLDLTRREGMLCAQMLGDLGADVIQVEPPGGAEGRGRPPFVHDRRDIEASLTWRAYARGKRSIVLDINAADDRETLRALIERADFLIESEAVGALASIGFANDDVRALNPRLIHISITPFGLTGPRAHWPGSDLIAVAAGGPMAIAGDSDRAPVRTTVPQAFQHAATDAAFAALVALHERHRSGLGQHIGVSAQQAVTICTQSQIVAAAVNSPTPQRSAQGPKVGDMQARLTYQAKDGYASITHVFGAVIGPATARLMHYVHDQGFCDAAMRDKDWVRYGDLLASGAEPISEFERAKQVVSDCISSKTKLELLDAAMTHRLLLAPVSTMADVVNSPQLASRGYFQVPPDEPDGLRFPGPFARFSATPIVYRRPAPSLDAHRAEILKELTARPGAAVGEPRAAAYAPMAWTDADAEVATHASGAGNATPAATANAGPLAGLKVLDFMWAIAGPQSTRMLADFGATVVRVESRTRMDVCRTVGPFLNAINDPEGSALYHTNNVGKLMLTLDLTNPATKEVVFDLVRWADVVTESFSPRAMKAFGLEWETLRKINPQLIMLSTCLMGQTGPLALYAGFGNLAAAITGFHEVAGWADREPAGPFGAYTDYMAPRFNATAILAALEHRRRTGEGQYIDMSQAEAAVHFLAPAALDYVANGHVWTRAGNTDAQYAPHGAYPAAGEDRWVAIACETDAQWRALAPLIGIASDDSRYAAAATRKQHESELDAQISAFTRGRDALAIATQLQAVGVPSYPVQNSPELMNDPQLAHLEHFHTVAYPDGRTSVVEGVRAHFSRTPGRVGTQVPMFNADKQKIVSEILGYTAARVAELERAGVLE